MVLATKLTRRHRGGGRRLPVGARACTARGTVGLNAGTRWRPDGQMTLSFLRRATSSRANFLIELSTTTSVDGVGVDWSAGIAVGATASAKRSQASSGRWQASAARPRRPAHSERGTTVSRRRHGLDENCVRASWLRIQLLHPLNQSNLLCTGSFSQFLSLSLHCTSYIHFSILSEIDLPDRWFWKSFVHQTNMVDSNKQKQWLQHRPKTRESHFKFRYVLGPQYTR